METRKRLYIVSFGNSDRYRYEYDVPAGTDMLRKPSPFAAIEKRLNDYLSARFPQARLAYFTTPKATEVYWDHRDRYKSYPPLDEKAIKAVEKTLAHQIQDFLTVRSLNSDAPYGKVNVPVV